MNHQNVQFIQGVSSSRPELQGLSTQSIAASQERDQYRNLFRNLEMCYQAARHEETLSGGIQKSFLLKPKTPYLMRMEKSLCDLTSPSLTSGVMYIALFKISEKYYIRYLESGVWKGFFLSQAYSEIQKFVRESTCDLIAELLFWLCIYTQEDQVKHHERYEEMLSAKRLGKDHATKPREVGKRFNDVFEKNTTSFLTSHQGVMAQIAENLQSGEDTQLVGSICCIEKMSKKRSEENKRYLYCTGIFQGKSEEWEQQLQSYRVDSTFSNFLSIEDLFVPREEVMDFHNQCKLISTLPNFHYWEADSNVGFSRMLSVRDPSGKYKPASLRNRTLLALRENNYSEARTLFQKFLHVGTDHDEYRAGFSNTVHFADEPLSISDNCRRKRIRRMTIPDILSKIGQLDPSFATENQSKGRDAYETFKISLVENGVVHWQHLSPELDIICFNEFDMQTGSVYTNKFVHLSCIFKQKITEFRCSCQLYSTLMQLTAANIPEVDEETVIDVRCCHIHFYKEHMLPVKQREVTDPDTISKVQHFVFRSKLNQRPVVEMSMSPCHPSRKFSVVSSTSSGFVHLTKGIIGCQSGECQAMYKNCRRKAQMLQHSLSLCPHLNLMKINMALWMKDEELESFEDFDEDGDDQNDDTTVLVLEPDNDFIKVFDEDSGLWSFPSLSKHIPAADGDEKLQSKFQHRLTLTDANGARRDVKGYLWCNDFGPFVVKPSLPNSPDCNCGASYYSSDVPNGCTREVTRNLIIYTMHSPLKFAVHERNCLGYSPECNMPYLGQEDCVHLLSHFTGAGDEIGWDFLDRVMKSQITFSSYCDMMTNQYRRLNANSAPFMSINTFLDWWFSWASNFKIDFRSMCHICKDSPRMLACDGTKIGIRLRHSKVCPIENPTSSEVIDPSHRRNERAFFNYPKGHPSSQKKTACRTFLHEICGIILGDKELSSITDNEEREMISSVLASVDPSCRSLFERFLCKQYPEVLLKKLAKVLKILSSSHSLSSIVPYRFLNFFKETVLLINTESNPNPAILNDVGMFSPEIRDVLLVALDYPQAMQDFTSLLSYIVRRVEAIFDSETVKQADTPAEQPGSYNPQKYGCAYYFTVSGTRLRSLPVYSIDTDCHSTNYDDLPSSSEDVCQKRFPLVSQKGVTYLFLWFDPLHYGHCYGYHMIPGSEGRKDPFSSAYLYMPTAPEEIFYDFACQLEEYCLNREPGFFKNTRFFHDVFHGFSHKCPAVYKSKRFLGLRQVNTEICEQFNSFIQRIKYSARSMTMTRFNFYLQFMIHQWSEQKRRNFQLQCNAAAAYMF